MPKTDQLSRRALLGASAAAAAVMAAPAALTGAEGVVKGDHPDAALLAAWDAYRKELAILDAMPCTSAAEAAREAQWDVVTAHADTIRSACAATMDGLNVQLRYLFASLMECGDSERAVVLGAPMSAQLQADLEGDYRHRMLWRMVENTTPGRRPPVEA